MPIPGVALCSFRRDFSIEQETDKLVERELADVDRLHIHSKSIWAYASSYEGSQPTTTHLYRLLPPECSFTLEGHVHHRRTIRASGSDHGAAAGSGWMPLGSRADLRHHQTLHAGRNLRSPRSHRQSR